MTILAIETSTPHGSVALLANGELLFEETFTADRSHSAALFGALERALQSAPAVDELALGLGPGSYAGVRIAIAAAIGLQLGTGAALVGLPSVAALDVRAADYFAIGDARRAAFYFTRVIGDVCAEGPQLLSEGELHTRLERDPDVPVFTSVLLPAFPNARIAQPGARPIARIVARKIGVTARDSLEPVYLREPHITTSSRH